jgi:hypothetical protein
MADKYLSVNQGKVWIASRNAAGVTSGYTWMGDCDQFVIKQNQTFVDFYESYSGNRVRTVHVPSQFTMEFQVDVRNIDGPNLARAFYGSQASGAGASVTGEVINAYAGSMVPLKYPGVSSVVVTKTAGSTTLVAGTDYTVDAVNGTLTFLAGSTAVTGTTAVPCTVAYTYAAYSSRVKALTDTIKDYTLRFEGRSQYDGLTQVGVLHRANFSLAAQLDLISAQTGVLSITGALLPANDQPAGESQYFTYVQA